MNCYQCVEKEKCPLRTDPDMRTDPYMRKLFRCKYAEDAEDEQQAEIEQLKAEKTKELDYLFSKFAGHSNYHGDSILCAIEAVKEGKEIETVKTMDEEEPKKEHAGKPAQINYLPICSECGEVITGEVKTIRTIGKGITDYEINPEVCPNCGAVFNGIAMIYPTLVETDERSI